MELDAIEYFLLLSVKPAMHMRNLLQNISDMHEMFFERFAEHYCVISPSSCIFMRSS